MLIIEGPDGVGKTTLARKLLVGLPTHVYAHFTRLPSGFDYYWGYRERASRSVVQDRFHMSEVAYAVARGEPSRLDAETYRLVDGHLRGLGAVTVLLTAGPDLVRSRWDDGQMYDLGRTLAAAEVYEVIAGGGDAGVGPVDLDVVIQLSGGKPYATDDDARAVLELYRRRQVVVDDVGRRRPVRL